MQGTMSVTKCLTLLAMVLAIALGGHAVSADTTSSTKAKQLVSLGSMPSSPSSVADEDSKMHSLRTRDTTSAETAEEREVGLETAGLKKALIVVEEAPIGTRLRNFLPDSTTMARMMSQVKAKLLTRNSPKTWLNKGWLPNDVETYPSDIPSAQANILIEEFKDLFYARDARIRTQFNGWFNQKLENVEKELKREFQLQNEAAEHYAKQYKLYRWGRMKDFKNDHGDYGVADWDRHDAILAHMRKWHKEKLGSISKKLGEIFWTDMGMTRYYEDMYQKERLAYADSDGKAALRRKAEKEAHPLKEGP